MRCDFLFDSYAVVLKLHRSAVCARRERGNRFVRRHLRPPTNFNRDTMPDRRQADQEVDIAAWRLYRLIRDPFSGGIDRDEHPGFATSQNYKRALEAQTCKSEGRFELNVKKCISDGSDNGRLYF